MLDLTLEMSTMTYSVKKLLFFAMTLAITVPVSAGNGASASLSRSATAKFFALVAMEFIFEKYFDGNTDTLAATDKQEKLSKKSISGGKVETLSDAAKRLLQSPQGPQAKS